jgi:aminopeptidase N
MSLSIISNRVQNNENYDLTKKFITAFNYVLKTEYSDLAAKAEIMRLPNEEIIKNSFKQIEPIKIYNSTQWLSQKIVTELFDQLLKSYRSLQNNQEYSTSYIQASYRSLKNTLLQYLSWDTTHGLELAYKQYEKSSNMTDRLAALQALNNHKSPLRKKALDNFQERYCNDQLVLDKWLFLEASHPYTDTLDRVKNLLSHTSFNIENPNKIRSLLGTFANYNATAFHNTSGQGYKFIADQVIIIDKFNPQASARLASAFQQWSNYKESYSVLMKNELIRIINTKNISKNLTEIVLKSLEFTV